MISPGDGDLAEMFFGHARFVHVAAHDERNFTVWSHDTEGHFVVAGIGGRAAVTAAFAKWRGRSNDQHKVTEAGGDCRRGVTQQ